MISAFFYNLKSSKSRDYEFWAVLAPKACMNVQFEITELKKNDTLACYFQFIVSLNALILVSNTLVQIVYIQK